MELIYHYVVRHRNRDISLSLSLSLSLLVFPCTDTVDSTKYLTWVTGCMGTTGEACKPDDLKKPDSQYQISYKEGTGSSIVGLPESAFKGWIALTGAVNPNNFNLTQVEFG